jgi:hypothetical protein
MTMAPTNSRPAELALPVASLAALRRALASAVGPDAAARSLQAAGQAAGDAFFRALVRSGAPGLSSADERAAVLLRQLPEHAFWRRFADVFASRGWGTLRHESVHEGVGALQSWDWVESDPAAGAIRPGCFFSTGLLANVLGQVADDDVAVLEVECRSQGDDRCRFLFGGPAALEELFVRIQAGQDVHASLATLA